MLKVGIMIWGFVERILRCLMCILVLIDEAVCLALTIPFFLALGWPRPNAGNTISSTCGYYAIMGHKWALTCEWFIDRLFYIPNGFRLGHCREHIEWDDVI